MSSSHRRGAAARQSIPARRRAFLTVESLEERTVLAGNVVASAAGGYLTFIGDNEANLLTVTRVGTSSVQVTSTDGTTVNGNATPQTFNNVTQGVLAVLGNGNDELELRGSTTDLFRVYGTTSINTGEGNDIVRFTNYSTWNGLILLTGGGDDQVFGQLDAQAPSVTVGGLRVDGPAIINTGAGNDNVSLLNSTFQSNVTFDAGAGNDTVDIRNTAFNRITSLSGSIGTDTLNRVADTFRYAPFIYSFENQTSTAGPTANTDTATVAEGGSTTISVLTNDTASSGTINTSTVTIVTAPTRGTAVVNNDGTITYTNGGGEFASDAFTYTVRDSQGNLSNSGTVNVTVTPVNDLPVATNDTFTVNEGATATLNLSTNDIDAENQLNRNSIQIITQPTNGTVTVGTNGNVTYVSNGNEVTSDSFTYTISDQSGGVSTAGTVNITINPVNDPPTIGAISNVSTNEDTATGAINVTVNDAETAAGTLNVTATSSNQTLIPNGSLVFGGSGSNRTLTITPAANASGTSTITVTTTDANNLSTTRTFVVTVNAVNDAPTITNVSDVSVNEDTATAPISFTIGDQETALGSLTVTGTSSDPTVVANTGIVISGTGANRTIVVTPVLNASGTSTITLNVSDGTTTTQETFVVTVNPQNDLPTISTIADVTAGTGTTINPIAITIGDVETPATGLTLSATSDNQALVTNGGISFTGAGASRNVVVTPVAGASGTANITVRATDANGGFVDETFAVTINALPTITTINDQTINEDANTGALTFTIGDTETSAANLMLSATSSNPTLVPLTNITFAGTGANRTVLVTPVANGSGSSTINVTVTDANGLTATEQFVVNVTDVNDLPTLSTISNVNVIEDATISPFNISVGDVETALANLAVTATSSNQSLIANSGISITGSGATRSLTLTQVPNASGTAIITVQVADGNGGTTTQTFNVNVTAVNDAPLTGTIGTQTVLEGSSVLINLGAAATDVDSTVNTSTGIVITQQPAHGTITLNGDGTATYTHNDSETTSDSFKYTIADAQGAVSTQATVNLAITPVNDAPNAVNDVANVNIAANATTGTSVSGNVLTNDTDADTNLSALSVVSLSSGTVGNPVVLTYGTLTVNANGTFTFNVDPNAIDSIMGGTDLQELFSYQVSDGEDAAAALLTINIHVV